MSAAGAARNLVAGIGFRSTATPDDIVALVRKCLAAIGRDGAALAVLATTERKHSDAKVYEAAARLGCPVALLPDAVLNAQPVRTSERVKTAIGVGSVAEAAALHYGPLLGERQASACVTCAISELAEP